jgi:HAD superfamily hydrolase (TIGR01509 family)
VGGDGKGLLLDFDGTVADSLGALKRVYQQVVERFGGHSGMPTFDAVNGVPLAEIAARLTADVGDAAEVHRFHRDCARAVYDAIDPNPGVSMTLELAVGRGWLPVIVTSNERDVVRSWLERTRLAPFIVDGVSVEDVTRGKPDPEPYRLALERIGRSPDRALAVEDGPLGARSATEAGIATVGLGAPADGQGWPLLVGRIASFNELRAWL